MGLFHFDATTALCSELMSENSLLHDAEDNDYYIRQFGSPANESGLYFTNEAGTRQSASGFENQFIVFQLSNQLDGPAILESSQVQPSIAGSEALPDMLLNLEMLNFSIAVNEEITPETRATIRITVGKDENSRDRMFDTAFWTIAAGLDLYRQQTHKQAEGKEFKADFKKAFNNRPIEIPGSLSKMSFEVVKHTEPRWWQRIFKFLQSDAGKSLTSVIGFPAVTTSAISLIDEFLNKIEDNKPETLFKSLPLRLALSQQAKDDFSAGNPRIKTGCLNPGFAILARAKDYQKIIDADPVYYPAAGRLVPSKVPEAAILTGKYDDPFWDITYSIFRVGMSPTKLSPTFNYNY